MISKQGAHFIKFINIISNLLITHFIRFPSIGTITRNYSPQKHLLEYCKVNQLITVLVLNVFNIQVLMITIYPFIDPNAQTLHMNPSPNPRENHISLLPSDALFDKQIQSLHCIIVQFQYTLKQFTGAMNRPAFIASLRTLRPLLSLNRKFQLMLLPAISHRRITRD